MAYRSDRRGDVPITSVASAGPLLPIGTPRATFHRGQGTMLPLEWAGDTTAVDPAITSHCHNPRSVNAEVYM